MKILVQFSGRLPIFIITLFTVLAMGCAPDADVRATVDDDGAETLIVYKNPRCGCCDKWITHMQSAGFDVTVKNRGDATEVKNRYGIQRQHRSCHTAVSEKGGFVFEGHVPASIIQRFLAAPPPNSKGLLVPGMPVGSPGMEEGNKRSSYDVLLLTADGDVEVYSHVAGNAGT